MPAPATPHDFLVLIRRSNVCDRTALDEFEARHSHDPSPDVSHLAKRMVREGILTILQANQLIRGKWRNFVLGGKYKLLEHLGTGGMGQVFLCEHLLMHRRVAVKILPPEKAADDHVLGRFKREAKAAAALNHPNIVRAHDFDCDTNFNGRLYFLVMEYVDGSNLQEIVKRFGPLSIQRACHYVCQAARGLQFASDSAGLVHRDIKPANLLLDRSGLIKILDLGLARFLNDADDDLTRQLGPRNVIGTVDYLAPEQVNDSHSADIRADVYSLGVTFFYLLTGRLPFKDGSIAQKLIWHQSRQPTDVRKYRGDVPEAIAHVIQKMLAKQPSDRYQQPIEIVTALNPWTSGPVAAPPESEMPRLSRAASRVEPTTLSLTQQAVPTDLDVKSPRPSDHGSASRLARWGTTVVSAMTSMLKRIFSRSQPQSSTSDPNHDPGLTGGSTTNAGAAQQVGNQSAYPDS